MQSPFPGMDPYLEGNLWTSVHADLATTIAHQLVPHLRPKYIALTERKYISGAWEEVMISAGPVRPDIAIRRSKGRSLSSNGALAVAPSVKLRTHLTTKVPHFRIAIRDVQNRRLVTAIELLSPTNKGSGRNAYLRKRRKFLHTSAHLLEIDLHHQGQRIPLFDPYPEAAYYVLLNRARKRSVTEVWAIGMDEPLPTVPVPLLKGDADVPLDMQKAFTAVYDAGGFDLVVDYRKPPDVELPVEEAEWLNEHLRGLGLRKA
jgi:Protein of unknown function (DUF4058)